MLWKPDSHSRNSSRTFLTRMATLRRGAIRQRRPPCSKQLSLLARYMQVLAEQHFGSCQVAALRSKRSKLPTVSCLRSRKCTPTPTWKIFPFSSKTRSETGIMMGGRSGFAASRATICLIIMQSLRLDAGWRLRGLRRYGNGCYQAASPDSAADSCSGSSKTS